MAQVTIHNVSDRSVYLGDLYTEVPVGGQVVIERAVGTLERMPSVQRALADQEITLGVEMSVPEIVSGTCSEAQAAEATDMAPVLESVVVAPLVSLRVVLGEGSAVLFDAGALPENLRVLSLAYLGEPCGVLSLWTPLVRTRLVLESHVAGYTAWTVSGSILVPAGQEVRILRDVGCPGELVGTARWEL